MSSSTPSSGSEAKRRKKLMPPAFAAVTSKCRVMLLTVKTDAISDAIGNE